VRLQPCKSPVWDTALALNALLESGTGASHPAVLAAARWLLDHEVTEAGDWQHHLPGVPPSGWYFEYANEFYPDCDDTAEVLTVLAKVRFPDAAEDARRQAAIARGSRWLLAMQNDDGGWGAFDRGCDQEVLTFIPFADHNAMIDPSCEDVTGRTLETLASLGQAASEAARRAVAFVSARRCGDGSWYGRWGCNYLYGTWLAVTGLRHGGVSADDLRVQAGVRWLRSVQNEDGGWGETQASYEDPSLKGCGDSTAAQTAWALMALVAAGGETSEAASRGVCFLLDRQRDDGSWYDEPWTATGFPQVFYLRYHLYATTFPLKALGAFLRAIDRLPERHEVGSARGGSAATLASH